jgi:two-component system, NtrC family, sensor kinase
MDQIRRMEATITRFLDFARPQEPVFTPVDVKELTENALLVVRPRARQQETAIGIEVGSTLPKITGDRKQLGEVLLNLMVNALEAMQRGGQLTVSAKSGASNGEAGNRRSVRIDIRDTGPGVTETNLAKIFDPFFTTKATGTGLGLSIVYSTIQRHGGKIEVRSRLGEGTTFTLFFSVPAEQAEGEDGKNTDC